MMYQRNLGEIRESGILNGTFNALWQNDHVLMLLIEDDDRTKKREVYTNMNCVLAEIVWSKQKLLAQ